MIAVLALIVAALLLVVAVLTYRHVRGHDAATLALQREQAARTAQAHWCPQGDRPA
jgi:hypothetical protein